MSILHLNVDTHTYTVDGEKLPGVTTILGILDKQLSFWGMQVGIRGIHELYTRHPNEQLLKLSFDELMGKLREEGLTVDQIRDKAGDRGNAAHQALQAWAVRGTFPDPTVWPLEERGYVTALASALLELNPTVVDTEQSVASLKYRYAGTYDGLWIVDNVRVLVDLKTSKRVYDTHHLQLAAYELARREEGKLGSDQQRVLHVRADGTYDWVRSVATAEMWLGVKAAYDALEALKDAKAMRPCKHCQDLFRSRRNQKYCYECRQSRAA